MRKLSIIFFLSICISCFSQDALFLNSNQSLIALNPSFAGTNGLVRNQFLFRNQWPNLSGNYKTIYNSFDAYIKPIHGGLAFSYTHDDQAGGTLRSDGFNLMYAQHISLCKGKLKIIPSLQLGYFIKRLDISKLRFGDPMDPRTAFGWYNGVERPKIYLAYFDFASGLLINYNHFYVGASVSHINQPDVGMYGPSKLPCRLNAHASYNLSFSEKSIMRFSARYVNQQNFMMLHLGIDAVVNNWLIIGGGYRNQDAVNLLAGYRNNYFTVQCGYDVTISKLAGNTAGSYEVSASFNLRNKELRRTLADFEKW